MNNPKPSPLALSVLLPLVRGLVETPDALAQAALGLADDCLAPANGTTTPASAEDYLIAEWIGTVDKDHAEAMHRLFAAVADGIGWHLRQWERDPDTIPEQRLALSMWDHSFRRAATRANARRDELNM